MTGLDATVEVVRDGFRLDVALAAEPGETVAVLGPNGSGKTTLLRVLAGLLPADGGRVVLDGEQLDGVPAEDRSVSLVFQGHALFAHLSALDNVAFGLRWGRRRVGKVDARALAQEWLERLGLADRAQARPRELSGGQAQRVALARSLAVEPRLLLLDEPLAALDVTTRGDVRRELRQHLAAHDGIRLLVTHDPLDAFALADRIVVLEGGQVTQSATPAELVARPVSPYVADLVGVNLWWGTAREGPLVDVDGGGRLVAATAMAGPVGVVVHPRAVALHRTEPEGSPRNVWPGTVSGVELLGDRVRVRVDGRPPIVAEVTPAAREELALEPGAPVWVSVKASELTVFAR